jgi:hypothetical protein
VDAPSLPKKTRVFEQPNHLSISIQEVAESYRQVQTSKKMAPKPVRISLAPFEYWKIEYPDDYIKLPEHPFLEVEDYTVQVGKPYPYRCFHSASACLAERCNILKHLCCHVGYDLESLKIGIKKQVHIWKGRVERLIHDSMLDKHKWWPETNWTPRQSKINSKPSEIEPASQATV